VNLRLWLLVALGVTTIGGWYLPLSPRTPLLAALASGASLHCPSPPPATAGQAPLQSAVPSGLQAFQLAAARLQPLAGFGVEARILSRKDYGYGRESALSPTDLALGWGAMAAPGVAERLEIRQSDRWYHYRWTGSPPLPPREIARNSANMHMIPFDDATAGALRRIRPGQRVRIDGWLVEAMAPDGWRWRSSLSRDDQGDGACEVVYICAITPL
jgi:hypothetical protein